MHHVEPTRRRRRRDALFWAAARLDRALSELYRDPSDRFATQVEHLFATSSADRVTLATDLPR